MKRKRNRPKNERMAEGQSESKKRNNESQRAITEPMVVNANPRRFNLAENKSRKAVESSLSKFYET
jgi:hypothetical protein